MGVSSIPSPKPSRPLSGPRIRLTLSLLDQLEPIESLFLLVSGRGHYAVEGSQKPQTPVVKQVPELELLLLPAGSPGGPV